MGMFSPTNFKKKQNHIYKYKREWKAFLQFSEIIRLNITAQLTGLSEVKRLNKVVKQEAKYTLD